MRSINELIREEVRKEVDAATKATLEVVEMRLAAGMPGDGSTDEQARLAERYMQDLRVNLAELWDHWLAEGYAAGWMDSLSLELRQLVGEGGGGFGMVTLGEADALKILRLVTIAGAWPSFDEKRGVTTVVAAISSTPPCPSCGAEVNTVCPVCDREDLE